MEDGESALRNADVELLKLIGRGLSLGEIAVQLGTTREAVEAEKRQLQERLGIHTLAGLIAYAIRHNIVD